MQSCRSPPALELLDLLRLGLDVTDCRLQAAEKLLYLHLLRAPMHDNKTNLDCTAVEKPNNHVYYERIG